MILVSNVFLMTPKHKQRKDKLDRMKVKNAFASEDTIKKAKRQHRMRENVVNHVSAKWGTCYSSVVKTNNLI